MYSVLTIVQGHPMFLSDDQDNAMRYESFEEAEKVATEHTLCIAHGYAILNIDEWYLSDGEPGIY